MSERWDGGGIEGRERLEGREREKLMGGREDGGRLVEKEVGYTSGRPVKSHYLVVRHTLSHQITHSHTKGALFTHSS